MSSYSDRLKELKKKYASAEKEEEKKTQPTTSVGSSYQDRLEALQKKYPAGSAEKRKAQTAQKQLSQLDSSIKKQQSQANTRRGRSAGLSATKPTAADTKLQQDYAKRNELRDKIMSIDADSITHNKNRDAVLGAQLDVAKKQAEETGYSNTRAKTSTAAKAKKTEAQKQLATVNKDKDRTEKLVRYEDKVYDDDFVGQTGTNYVVGRLTQDSSLAWNEYLDNPTEKNRRYAESLDATLQKFIERNTEALDDEDAKLTWISKSLANYMPQFLDQASYSIQGGIAGAAAGSIVAPGAGTIKGAKVGVTMASGAYSYKTMRGAAFKNLLAMGVDEATAREAARDEAVVSALIEMGDTAVTLFTSGTNKIMSAAGKGGLPEVGKLLAKWAGQDKAKRVAVALGRYGLNIGSEMLEEASQEAVSIANQERVESRNTDKSLVGAAISTFWGALTGKNKEAADQIWTAALEGGKIAAMMGGADVAFTQTATQVVGRVQAESMGAQIRANGQELGMLAQAKTDYAADTKTHKLAVSLESKMKTSGRATLTDLETGRLFEQMLRDDAETQIKTEDAAKKAAKVEEKSTTAKIDAQTEADLVEMTTSEDQASAEYASAQLSNPESTVVSPVAQRLMTAGVKNAVAVEQASLIQKMKSGHKLTEAEVQKLQVSDPVVRAAIEAETGVQMTGTSKADKRNLAKSTIETAQEVKAQEERTRQAAVEQQAGQTLAEKALAQARAAAETAPPATQTVHGETGLTPAAAPAVSRDNAVAALVDLLTESKSDPAVGEALKQNVIKFEDGSVKNYVDFVDNYKAEHKGATDEDAARVFYEWQQLNRMGKPVPPGAKVKAAPAGDAKASVGETGEVTAQVREFNGKQLSEAATAEAKRLEQESLKRFGKSLGVEVEFQEFDGGEAEANGYYVKLKNTIVLNSRKVNGLRNTTRIFLHEVTHPAQDADVNLTRDILNTIKEARGEEYLNMLIRKTRDAYVAFYRKNNYDLGTLNVASEVAADYMMNTFASRSALDKLAGIKPSLIGKLLRRLGVIRQADGLDASVRSHLDKLAGRMVEAQQKAKEQKSTATKDSAAGENKKKTAETPLMHKTSAHTPEARVSQSSKTNITDSSSGVKKQFSVNSAAERAESYTYGSLVKKPDMKVVTVGDAHGLSKAQVVSNAKRNAAKIGSVNPKDGSVSVHVKDIGLDVILATNGLKHGFDRRFADLAPVTLVAGEVLQNSIRINELTPQKANAEASYVLIGAAKSKNGEPIIVRSVVNRFSNELTSMDVLYAIHAKKESAALLPRLAGDPAIRTDSIISIAALLEYVNQYFPDVLPESVLKHFGHDARPEGVLGKDALFSVNVDTGYEEGSIQDRVLTLLKSGTLDDAVALLQEWADELEAGTVEVKPEEKAFRDALFAKRKVTPEMAAKNRQKLDDLIAEYGEIEPGEKSAREVIIPAQVAEGRGVSRHVRTVLESEHTPEWFVAEAERLVAENAEGYTYDIATDKAAMAHVKEKKKRSFQRNLQEWEDTFNSVDKALTKNDIALGEFLYTEAVKAGDVATATRLVAELSAAGTRAGQTVQAMSLLKKMTPSGQLYYLQQAVDRLNRELKKQGKDKQIVVDVDLAKTLMEAKTTEEMQEAMDGLLQDIANQAPVTVMDKWNTWRYLAMLGNPRTHIRNLASNAVFAPAVFLKDIVGAVAQLPIAREDRTKSLGQAFASLSYGATFGKLKASPYVDFADADFEAMENVIRGGGKQNPSDLIRDKRPVFKSKATQWIGTASKKNSQWMEAEDKIFLKWHYVRALSQYLAAQKADLSTLETTAEGRNELARAREWAVREAQKATFRDASAFASALSRFEHSNKAANLLVGSLMPFKKTPINVLKRGLEYSPLGVIKMVTDGLKHKQSAAQFIDRLASSLTGTGIAALGYYLAMEGLLRGSGSGDEKEEELEELQGAQDYSLQLNDGTSFTIDWMAPVALPLFVGCEAYNIFVEGDEFTWADAANAISQLGEPMFNLSMLDGLNNTLQAVKYGDNAVLDLTSSLLTSYVGQAIPTVLGQIARTMDGTRRTTYIDKNKDTVDWMDRSVQYNQTKIPGASESLVPKLDAWGRPDTQASWVLGALENFLSPGYVNSKKTSAMEDELLRLYKTTGATSVLPKTASKYFTVNGERYDLSGEEWTTYQVEMGQGAYEMLTSLVNASAYRGLTDAQKVAAVEDVYEYAQEKARTAAVGSYTSSKSWVAKADKLAGKGISVEDYIMQAVIGAETPGQNTLDVIGIGWLTDDAKAALISAAYGKSLTNGNTFTDPYKSGYQYTLTTAQVTTYLNRFESLWMQEYRKLIATKQYKAAADKDKAEMLDDLKSDIATDTKKWMARQLTKAGVKSTKKE